METRKSKLAKISWKILISCLITIFLVVQMNSVSYSQVDISNFEHAEVIPTGSLQNTASYGIYFASYDGNTENFFNMFGYNLGIGIVEQFDLRVSYNLIHGDWTDILHMVQIAPKYSSKSGIFAVKANIGIFFRSDKYYNEEKTFEKFYRINPRILVTPVSGKNFDMTFTPTFDVVFDKEYTAPSLGLNFGMGFSSNFDIWAFRPEVGFVKGISDGMGEGTIWTVGFGVNFNIRYKKKS